MNAQSNSHLHKILSRLNQIGSAINLGASGGLENLQDTLRLIVDSATEVVPDSSAIIYTYDTKRGAFNLDSRVSSELNYDPDTDDTPRPNGIGAYAIATKKRVLSYEQEELNIHPAKVAAGAKAMVCYPLIIAEETLGVLYLYLHERDTFSELELLMLDNMVNLTAMTLASTQRFTEAQLEQERKGKELRRLHRAGMLISSHTRLQDTLDAILRMALEVTDAKYGIFRLVDKDGTCLNTHAFAGELQVKPATESLPIDQGSVMGTVALKRSPLIIPDLSEEPWSHLYYPLDHELVMRSEVAVPLIGASERLEGVLNLESPQVNAFSKQDLYILQILATHAVAAIQEVRLLDALQEISTYILTQPLQSIHQNLVDQACDLLNVPLSVLWLREDDLLCIQAATQPGLEGRQIGLQDSLIGQATLGGEALISSELRLDVPKDCYDPADYGSSLIVPLFAPEEPEANIPVGAFSIHSAAEHNRNFEQSEWDKNVLSILGYYATLAIQNAAHQEAARLAQEQRTVIEAFAAIGDIASNLMHQLNNKIGAIPVRIEGIQDKSASTLAADPYLSQNLTEIDKSAATAIEILKENLFYLRPIRFSSVEIEGAIDTALTAARLPKSIKIVREDLHALPPVHACPKRLPLVFINLFDNAARAMQDKGEIYIRGVVNGDRVQIDIQDTGPGISPELHERIFELNYSSQPSETHENLGFGLWWVKTLMTRFGGIITVDSDGQTGTTFTLELPVSEGPHDE
jgi:GAF domain-containing protein